MSTYNFHGPISGQSIFGDGGQNLIFQGPSAARAMGVADDLVRLLRAEQDGRDDAAVQLRGELARAESEERPVDEERVRGWLTTIREGSAAGSGALALIASLKELLGL
ncbi:hypothetical protein AB0P17_07180 [Streptomyces sp. NPDC088124]|uniref:hypothetical protein n=1 Tax=Streptomyces sp. NPDC088124 TaxID=3154654 RepID=UPI00342F898C